MSADRALAALLSAGALALLAACGQSDHVPSAAVAHASPAGEAIPRELDFTAHTIDGQSFSGSSIAGHLAVVWFWAPNCSDCVREAPHLLAAADRNHDVEFIAVSVGSPSDAKSAIARMKIGTLTQLVDADGSLWRRFGVASQPAYAFVDTAGRVDVHKGAIAATALDRAIAATAA
jgi:thiol-disulfide isomerase/thioredoxin